MFLYDSPPDDVALATDCSVLGFSIVTPSADCDVDCDADDKCDEDDDDVTSAIVQTAIQTNE
jgi:hypothetical protein